MSIFKNKTRTVLAVTTLISTFTGSVRAVEQGDSGFQLEEILVTAQKREESSQSVPIALTAIDTEQLLNAGAISVSGLNKVVSGLSINSTAAFFSPHLRGVGTASFGPGIENPVALYVDDVYYGSQVAVPSDLSVVSQVAVLKGPQGTLFGRNATGGVIQLTTRNPTHEFAAEASTELDNYLTSRSFGYLSGGVGNNAAAYLAVNYTKQRNGWGTNLVTGEENHRIDHDLGVRTKWVLTPSSTTEIRVGADYFSRTNSMGPNSRPIPGQPYGLAGGLAPSSVPTGFPINSSTPVAIIPAGYLSDNVYDSTSQRTDINKIDGGGSSIWLGQELGAMKLVSISAYRKYKYDTYFDTTAIPIQAVDTAFVQKGWQFSQELQLISTRTDPVSWMVGGYFYKSKDRVDGPIATLYGFVQDNWLTALASGDMFAPGFDINTYNPGSVSQALDYHVDYGSQSVAGFAQATWKMTPDTRGTIGLRYTSEKRTRDGLINLVVDGGSKAGTYLLSQAANGDTVKASKLTWRVAVDHDFADNAMGYVSYNRGFKSGGYNGLAQDLAEVPYKPEQLDAYEVGLKSDWAGNRLRVNPSVFYYKYSEIQVTKFESTRLTIQNGAAAKIYGINLDADWLATNDLIFNAGLEWLHARFTSYENAPVTAQVPLNGGIVMVPQPSAPGLAPHPDVPVFPGGTFNGYYQNGVAVPNGTINASGNQVPFAAKLSANIGATYKMPVGAASLSFNVNDTYNSGYPSEVDNRLKQGSTHIVNASITWTSSDDSWAVAIFGRNLLDDHIVTQIAGLQPQGDIADFGNPPRTWGASARYRFGAK